MEFCPAAPWPCPSQLGLRIQLSDFYQVHYFSSNSCFVFKIQQELDSCPQTGAQPVLPYSLLQPQGPVHSGPWNPCSQPSYISGAWYGRVREHVEQDTHLMPLTNMRSGFFLIFKIFLFILQLFVNCIGVLGNSICSQFHSWTEQGDA